jgi:hypothetical protein
MFPEVQRKQVALAVGEQDLILELALLETLRQLLQVKEIVEVMEQVVQL